MNQFRWFIAGAACMILMVIALGQAQVPAVGRYQMSTELNTSGRTLYYRMDTVTGEIETFNDKREARVHIKAKGR